MIDDKAVRLAAIRAANAQKATAARTGVPEAAARPSQPAHPAAPMTVQQQAPMDTMESPQTAVSLATLFTMLFAAVVGAFAAAVVLPRWLPGLSSSLLGAEPKAYWYLARSSALVAFGLLWLSMALGLCITSKVARVWIGGLTLFDVHQFTSLLALAFAIFHSLILLGDAYINYTLAQVLIPFGSRTFRPVAVGLGQVSLYVLALVGLSFYARPWIGRRAWRIIHFLSFAVFLLVLAHGVGSGTDTGQPLVRALYWGSGGSLLFLTIYRILIHSASQAGSRLQQRSTASKGAQTGMATD